MSNIDAFILGLLVALIPSLTAFAIYVRQGTARDSARGEPQRRASDKMKPRMPVAIVRDAAARRVAANIAETDAMKRAMNDVVQEARTARRRFTAA
jgi:hypothetical protein